MKNNKNFDYGCLFYALGLIAMLSVCIYGLCNLDGYSKLNNKSYNTTTSYTFYDFDYDYESLPSLDFSIPELISSEISSYQPPKEKNEIIVYVTEYGSKYHRITCGSLYNSAFPMELNEALEDGYGPCGRCHPPFPEFE